MGRTHLETPLLHRRSTLMNKRCTYCESDKEPYFSRVEPMGFYCVECGHNFDEVDPEDFKEIKKQLASERALANRLAEGLRKMVLYSEALILRIQDRSDINFKTLNEGIDLFNEWKEARND